MNFVRDTFNLYWALNTNVNFSQLSQEIDRNCKEWEAEQKLKETEKNQFQTRIQMREEKIQEFNIMNQFRSESLRGSRRITYSDNLNKRVHDKLIANEYTVEEEVINEDLYYIITAPTIQPNKTT